MRESVHVWWGYMRMGRHWFFLDMCLVRVSVLAEEGHTRMVLMHTRMGSIGVGCCIMGAVLPSLGTVWLLVFWRMGMNCPVSVGSLGVCFEGWILVSLNCVVEHYWWELCWLWWFILLVIPEGIAVSCNSCIRLGGSMLHVVVVIVVVDIEYCMTCIICSIFRMN